MRRDSGALIPIRPAYRSIACTEVFEKNKCGSVAI